MMFPFGHPGPTQLYLVLYVVTLAIHVLFMNYVLAGTFYLGASAVFGRTGAAVPGTIRHALVDWLPFGVGLAITAGVAPLLFLQILYEKSFYTANLLLFHRWMLIVPALIAGFYLLYLTKSDLGRRKPLIWRAAAVGAFLCFAFTAWSWTENHVLSRDEAAWVEHYAAGQWVYRNVEIAPRLAMWFVGAASTMAMLLGWQLRGAAARGVEVDAGDEALVPKLGLAGLVLGGICAAIYAAATKVDVIAVATGPVALPYTVLTALGGALQLVGWAQSLRRGELDKRALVLVSAGVGMSLLGSGVVRESVRLAYINVSAYYPQHAAAAEVSGFWLFLTFLVVNAGVVAFALKLGVAASRVPAEAPVEAPSDGDGSEA